MSRKFKRRSYWTDRAGKHAQHRKRRRWPWITAACVVVTLGALGAVGVVFATQALSVKDDLMAAKGKLTGLTSVIKTGDTTSLKAAGDQVLALTTRADGIVRGPLWDLAARIPFVGANVAAVQGATEAVHVLAKDAMPPALELMSTLNIKGIKAKDGGINLTPFQDALGVLPEINSAFAKARSHVAGIDRAQLLPVVDGAIGQLVGVVDDAGPMLQKVQAQLPTLLKMMGSEGKRTYIVLFQNNAESRATGGNAATSAVMEIDNGHIAMREGNDVDWFHARGLLGGGTFQPADDMLALYENDFTRYAQNFTRTPDFPTSAQMYATLWKTSTGGTADGVVSIDPVVLSYMLKATGPVKLSDGTMITADNAVKLLLSDVYERFGTNDKAMNAYFSGVTSSVFTRVTSGDWDPMTMLAQIQRGVQEQRVYAWFPTEDEERLVTGYGIDGTLRKDNATVTQVGVWMNDAAHSKLEYYLSTKLNVTCNADKRTITTSLTLSSAVPGPNLGAWTLGWRNTNLGYARTTMLIDVLGFAVPGGKITSDPGTGDIAMWNREGTENGRDGKSMTVAVPMGTTKTVSFTSTLPKGKLGPLQVRYSPTVRSTPVTIADSCSVIFPPVSK